ncbi:MAG: family efflux transporter [Clostridia bacterium]|jgi:putative MATE family efflux protein|nr:family efflux transporter [Clostridia bacterium]
MGLLLFLWSTERLEMREMHITKDRNFYKLILSIALPIACQNLITFAVSMADSVMVGGLGEVSLSAVTIANQLFFIFMLIIFGLGSGANILVAQYWGKGDTKAIHKVMSIIYKVSVLFAGIFMLIAACVPEQFMGAFTTDAKVIELGGQYLRTIFVSYIFFALTNVTISVLRSVQTVKISIVVYGVSLITNIFLNWVLIFGNLGAPVMGVKGAAIATACARLVEFLIALGFLIFLEKKIKFKPAYLLKTDKVLLKDLVVVGGPVVLNELVWALGSSTLALIVAKLGTEVVAANSINNVVWQFVSIFTMGAGHAGAVIIGNTVGAMEYEKTKEYASTLIFLSIALGLIGAVIMFGIRPYVLLLYNVSQNTKDIARQIMAAGSLMLVFQSVAFVLMIGVLRGGGDTKFVLVADIIFLWAVAIPLGYVAAVILHLPIALVFIALKCDEILKVGISLIRVKRGKWIRNVTR